MQFSNKKKKYTSDILINQKLLLNAIQIINSNNTL